MVCAYLTERAEEGVSLSTIDQACSAMGHQHRHHAVEDPIGHEAVRQVGWELLTCLEELAERHQAPAATVSLAWTLAQPGVTGVIVGPDSTTELAEASHAPDVRLTEEEKAMLDQRSGAASTPEFVTW